MCTPKQKELCGEKTCNVCFPRSLAGKMEEKGIPIDKFIKCIDDDNLTLFTLVAGSHRKCLFKCKNCNHLYETEARDYLRNKGCINCSKSMSVCSLNKCYSKTLYKWLSDHNILHKFIKCIDDISLTPISLTTGSKKRCLFSCKNCNHIYESSIDKFTTNKGCLYCKTDVCGDPKCLQCKENSLASIPNIENLWNYEKNGSITPYMIRKMGDRYCNFFCRDCGHEYCAQAKSFTRWTGCDYCPYKGSKLCDDLNCDKCKQNSFESHPRHIYWNYEKNNGITPRTVRKCCNLKFWFTCNLCGKDYHNSLNNIDAGKWCSCRKNKTEAKLYDWLHSKYPDAIKQYKILGITNSKYDFYIPSLKLIIELDGPQHFEQVSNWQDYKKTQYKDTFKSVIAIRKGYSLIRVYQPNVWDDKIDWKFELSKVIQKNSKPKIHFISDGYQYDDHKKFHIHGLNIYNYIYNLRTDTTQIKALVYLINMFRLDSDTVSIPNTSEFQSDLKSIATYYYINTNTDTNETISIIKHIYRYVLLTPVDINMDINDITITKIKDITSDTEQEPLGLYDMIRVSISNCT